MANTRSRFLRDMGAGGFLALSTSTFLKHLCIRSVRSGRSADAAAYIVRGDRPDNDSEELL